MSCPGCGDWGWLRLLAGVAGMLRGGVLNGRGLGGARLPLREPGPRASTFARFLSPSLHLCAFRFLSQ